MNPLDLDRIEKDLADVDIALDRLNKDIYWTDEVTGEQLTPEFLAQNPIARVLNQSTSPNVT